VRFLFPEKWEAAHGACESPLEAVFLEALVDTWGIDETLCLGGGVRVGKSDESDGMWLGVTPQFDFGPYRLDFLVTLHTPGQSVTIVCECDGRTYHDRTAQQGFRDRARDRFVQCAGIPVFRYSGEEIRADAAVCAKQVLEALRAMLERDPQSGLVPV
jgi:very-short-patch-repair endonuclease